MSQHLIDKVRYTLGLQNYPTFETNADATEAEQDAVFNSPTNNTGIVDHGYNGVNSRVGQSQVELFGVPVGNPGSLVIAPNQTNSGSSVQAIKLSGGQNVVVSRGDGVISGGNELVPGGLGMSPNILLNMPSSDGMYNGRPIWDYSAMERIDALPIYQANRARMLDRLADIVESDEYDFFIVAVPANTADSLIDWKDTFRTQVSVPPESLLVMILADFNPQPPG